LTNDKKCAIILLENESEEKIMDKKELKAYKKMSPEEVQGLIAMRRKGGAIKAKKGKGSYSRKDFKKGVA
jgi:stalled ribosome alternative rescue factor ArfA